MNQNYDLNEWNDEKIRSVAPSVFATAPHGSRSDSYQFVNTASVMNRMRNEGFMPIRAMQSRTTLADRKGFTRHSVSFKTPNDIDPLARLGDVRASIVIGNAHDGLGSFWINLEVWRLACLNGNMVSEGSLPTMRFTHASSKSMGDIIEGTYRIIDEVPRIANQVQAWRALPMPEELELQYIGDALALRYDKDDTQPTPAQLLLPKRPQDRSKDVWTVFNRVQEHVMRGGQRTMTATGRANRTRPVTSVDRVVSINQELWGLTERYVRGIQRNEDVKSAREIVDVEEYVIF